MQIQNLNYEIPRIRHFANFLIIKSMTGIQCIVMSYNALQCNIIMVAKNGQLATEREVLIVLVILVIITNQ